MTKSFPGLSRIFPRCENVYNRKDIQYMVLYTTHLR